MKLTFDLRLILRMRMSGTMIPLTPLPPPLPHMPELQHRENFTENNGYKFT